MLTIITIMNIATTRCPIAIHELLRTSPSPSIYLSWYTSTLMFMIIRPTILHKMTGSPPLTIYLTESLDNQQPPVTPVNMQAPMEGVDL